MFRFVAWILADAARVLNVPCSVVDIMLGAPAAPKKEERSGAALHDSETMLFVCARHDGGSRRVSTELTGHSAVKASEQLPEHHEFISAVPCVRCRDTLSEGYNGQAEELRQTEFRRLGSQVYVDHAGATLYSEKQLELAYKVTVLHLSRPCDTACLFAESPLNAIPDTIPRPQACI